MQHIKKKVVFVCDSSFQQKKKKKKNRAQTSLQQIGTATKPFPTA
jgi:hypothetical protein